MFTKRFFCLVLLPILLNAQLLYNETPLIPAPKQATITNGLWHLPQTVKINCSEAGKSEVKFLKQALLRHYPDRITEEVAQGGDIILELLSENTFASEAYELRITETDVRIHASDIRGLFYGIQTFDNLLAQNQPDVLNCQIIQDSPSHSMRIISMIYERMNKTDLANLKKNVEFCASLKYNTVLLGLMGGFPYRNLKFNVGLDVTWEDLQDFASFCKERHIEIIPYVQLLSHVRWLNTHEKWPSLLENPEEAQSWSCTWCPNNPTVRNIWSQVLEDHIALFNPRYFHIGMDEIVQGSVGICDLCKNTPPSKLLRDELNRYLALLKKHNVTPILWYDCLVPQDATRHFRPYEIDLKGWECLNDLPKGTLLQVWDYDLEVDKKAMNFLTEQGFSILGGAWNNKMGNIPLMSNTLFGYGKKNSGMMLCSWYYFHSKVEDSNYRALAGLVTASECFWNAGKMSPTLDEMTYDPVHQAVRRLHPVPKSASQDSWTSLPINQSFNTELKSGFYSPEFSDTSLTQFAKDYARLPQAFNINYTLENRSLNAAAVSGTPDGVEGLSPEPVTIPLNNITTDKLSFLLSLIPTGELELNQNELFVFDGKPLVGFLKMQYADGTFDTLELRHADNISNWNAPFSTQGAYFGARHKDKQGRLVHLSILNWTNRKPNIPLESVTLSSTFCRHRAIALYALSANHAQISKGLAHPTFACKYTDPVAPDWRKGQFASIAADQINKLQISESNLTESVQWRTIQPPDQSTCQAIEATVSAGTKPFGRVCFDIPVSIPSYAQGVGYTLWLEHPEVFRESSFYLMAGNKCLAHYITKLKKQEFFSDTFLNMADEGGRPDLKSVTTMRISFRLYSMQKVKIIFTIPTFYEILPVQFDWNKDLSL